MPAKRENWIILAFLLAYTIFAVATLPTVPYHPDESTQIYMSGDWERLFKLPNTVLIQPRHYMDSLTHLRLMDAPFARTMIFAARKLTGIAPLKADWDWSDSWKANVSRGAYPSEKLLFVARLICFAGVPIGLFFFYKTLRLFASIPISFIGLGMLSFSSSFLLHTRHAMAEPWMVSLFLILLWCTLAPVNKNVRILCCLVLPLIIQTKQSAIPFAALAGLIVFIKTIRLEGWKKAVPFAAMVAVFSVLISYLLNPVAWLDPIHTIRAALMERQAFTYEMLRTYMTIRSPLAAPTLPSRILAMISQLYFAPPNYTDGGTYASELIPSIPAYARSIIPVLLQGFVWGTIFFVLSITGMFIGLIGIRRNKSKHRDFVLILFLVTIFQFVLTISLIPIAFQRYYILFLPIMVLWTCIGFSHVFPVKQIPETLSG